MKLKRRTVEVPQKIRLFIDNVTAIPLENIEEPLRCFVWEFDKHIKSRKDLQLEDNFLAHDPPFPKAAVLQILHPIRMILENCANKHFYGSYEVAKALFDGQLLDIHFTRSFYKHILGIKVTYHDIEAVDPDYYKNLKWMLEAQYEEKHILYEKNEVTDYELKSGGRNIRVTEEMKHEYVDLVAEHILTIAITPQINSFLDGFNELIPRELIFHDKEIELLISGLPEIDLDDLKANTEYTGYTGASPVVQWFWEVVTAFNKEDMARLLQFVTGTSKVPLEGFGALQGISSPQKFQIHKAYGASDHLPSAHTCFNQLDLPEYVPKEQLQDRLLLAIHEANKGFGFG